MKGTVKCSWCNTPAKPQDMELITIGGERRVTCPCYRRFEPGELERFQEWLRVHAFANSETFLVIRT